MCIVVCVQSGDGGCKFSLLQKLFFQCFMRNIFLGGILTNEPRGPRVISFILCGHGYCRGSQRMTPPMVNAVKCSESRINRKTKPHLQTFLNEIKTQAFDRGRGEEQQTFIWKLNRNGLAGDAHPATNVYVCLWKICCFSAKKKKECIQDGPSRIQSSKGNRRHMLSSKT